VLSETAAPRVLGRSPPSSASHPESYGLLAGSFVLLVLGTARLLYRELRRRHPPVHAVLALLLVWVAALALRLGLSPHTFLHEYYHIAETVPAYLTGEMAPIYGNAGPALFRLVGRVLGRPEDVHIIFLTNAVVSSLAIPSLALLDLALVRSWPRAICAAVLLCVLPQHLRLSGAEDLFVQAVTLGLWSLAIFAAYLRTRRLDDALLCALALSLVMQTRPEMTFFPLVLVALVVLAKHRSLRLLFAWRTHLAVAALAALLIPRFIALRGAADDAGSPVPVLPDVGLYLRSLVLLQHDITPALYWVLLGVGLVWGVLRKPGMQLWVVLVFLGYTILSLSLFSNPQYDLRSQLLPTSFVLLVAAGVAPVWMASWRRRSVALGTGACALAVLAGVVLLSSRRFVTELGDQQLEWAFLERTVPRLPQEGTLLAAVDVGGHDLDAFPQFLLTHAGKSYDLLDVRRAARGDEGWPAPEPGVIYYQGMFCYFAFDDEPSPDPMTAPCKAVHDRYELEPLYLEDLVASGYSHLRYAGSGRGPFRIGFFRLHAPRL
jgi:hypothetical protein